MRKSEACYFYEGTIVVVMNVYLFNTSKLSVADDNRTTIYHKNQNID